MTLLTPDGEPVTCQSCDFWQRLPPEVRSFQNGKTITTEREAGTCRRYSPTGKSGSVWGWPLTLPKDWCGDHSSLQKILPRQS